VYTQYIETYTIGYVDTLCIEICKPWYFHVHGIIANFVNRMKSQN